MTEARELYNTVIKNGYCIGCGACSSVKGSPFEIQMNEYGNLIAFPKHDLDKSDAKVMRICPFSNQARNEDEISQHFFPAVENVDTKIGKHLACFAGYVTRGDFRKKGSSGGIGKWIGYMLLKEKMIDYFVQVKPNLTDDPKAPLFDYTIISDKDEILKGSKSAYHPVSLVTVLKSIKEHKGRYAITGVPCFIKALRLLSLQDAELKDRLKYTIGVICGGMKSANQSKMIGWHLGVSPENITRIDFRGKYKDKSAYNKKYQVWSNKDQIERYINAGELYGADWGLGFFKPKACDFCDDVVGETADISIGDAWLPQFIEDPGGTTIIAVRNAEILKQIKKYTDNGTLLLHELTAEELGKSQEGGFRHRREALSFRIANKKASGSWYPKKRVKEEDYVLSKKRKLIYSLREKISEKSHTAFLNALNHKDLNIFFREMDPLMKKYKQVYKGRLPLRIYKKVKTKVLRMSRRLLPTMQSK